MGSVLLGVSSFSLLVVLANPVRSRWLAWTCDAIDFFSVSLSVSRLEVAFGKSTSDLVGLTHVSDIEPLLMILVSDDFHYAHTAFPFAGCGFVWRDLGPLWTQVALGH